MVNEKGYEAKIDVCSVAIDSSRIRLLYSKHDSELCILHGLQDIRAVTTYKFPEPTQMLIVFGSTEVGPN